MDRAFQELAKFQMVQANSGRLPVKAMNWIRLKQAFEDEGYVLGIVFRPMDEYLDLMKASGYSTDLPPGLAEQLLDRLLLHLANTYEPVESYSAGTHNTGPR